MNTKDKTKKTESAARRYYMILVPNEYKPLLFERAKVERRKVSAVVLNALDLYFSTVEADNVKSTLTKIS